LHSGRILLASFDRAKMCPGRRGGETTQQIFENRIGREGGIHPCKFTVTLELTHGMCNHSSGKMHEKGRFWFF
jgi:hypothetical protein